MSYRFLLNLLLICGAVLAYGCSGRGPDVVDPASGQRTQFAFLALEGAEGELAQYSEMYSRLDRNVFKTANGDVPLGMPIDAIYDSFDSTLFLHHRDTGLITVMSIRSRKKVGEIGGFPVVAGGGLSGMAFSNLSQAWVICDGVKKLYHVDAVNKVIDEELPLEGVPTAVGTSGTRVFVAMILDDGTARVDTLRSNSLDLTPRAAYTMPSPVVYIASFPDTTNAVLITAGSGSAPTAHLVDIRTMQIGQGVGLDAGSMQAYIGEPPTFADISNDFYLYLATPAGVTRVDLKGNLESVNWLPGNYRTLGVDYWTDLLYIFRPDDSVLQRLTTEGEELAPVSVGAPVKAIQFVSPSQGQR